MLAVFADQSEAVITMTNTNTPETTTFEEYTAILRKALQMHPSIYNPAEMKEYGRLTEQLAEIEEAHPEYEVAIETGREPWSIQLADKGGRA